ncbi:nucleoside-diphosphate sugar epimerase [Pseudomonas sp. BN414]|uniref:SDR family oxidoreductase n=1 Tax=Pseudomonas TaxID=286 RepID=UPI0015BBCBB5|nr:MULTISPECIES: NmrA family NAD(P)-binding protein [Pseudomonas]MDH4565591.1 nucleoside-diphosphate sugar epimerase [Pseudomonas sp. BN414]NWL76016.1 nucleoside-diphosphate sugar epimerase [Pseudomonas taiwanensis]
MTDAPAPILVTSANGNQGKCLVPRLLAAGHRVRACVQSSASAEALRKQGVQELLVGDLAEPAFIHKAMRGVSSVYHIGPTLHPAERAMGFNIIDAAREEGVGHFVFSSVLHAITTDLVQHEIKRDIEEHLLSSGLEFTILQPANYMLAARLKPVFEEGVFRLSWALERYQSMVDLDDVAEVASMVLSQPERHLAATYELVGPGRFTAHEIGQVLSGVINTEIRVERIDMAAFVRARFGEGDPVTFAHQAQVSQSIETRYSNHDFLGNSNVLSWLLGREATHFEDFVRKEYAAYQAQK